MSPDLTERVDGSLSGELVALVVPGIATYREVHTPEYVGLPRLGKRERIEEYLLLDTFRLALTGYIAYQWLTALPYLLS